jgi:cytochrome bd-type quinol oxidase subunit 2
MRFKPLPTTGSEWDRTCLHCLLVAGFMLLTVQVWARLALSGWVRQRMEEMLWPLPLLFGFLLVCCSLIAALQRQRVLSSMAAVVGFLSALIALLPILLHEGVRN